MIIGLSLSACAAIFLYVRHKPTMADIRAVISDLFTPLIRSILTIVQKPGGPSGRPTIKRSSSSNPTGRQSQSSSTGNRGSIQTKSRRKSVTVGNGSAIASSAGLKRRPVDVPTIELVKSNRSASSSGSTTPTESSGPTFSIAITEHADQPTRPASSSGRKTTMPPPPFLPTPDMFISGPISTPGSNNNKVKKAPLPMFPAPNSAQRVSDMPAGSRSTFTAAGSSVRTVNHASAATTLSTNMNLLRGPGRGGQTGRSTTSTSPSLLNPTASTVVPNPRKKIALEPGFSPMDWAALQRSGENLSGVDGVQRVSESELASNNGRNGKPLWSSYMGRVYNVTPYLPFHPGGRSILKNIAGKSGDKLFHEYHSWVNWDNMLGECLVGVVVADDFQDKDRLDEMD